VSPEAFQAFSDLLETEAFHNATTFREQVALAVELFAQTGYQFGTVRVAKFSAYQKEPLCSITNDTDRREKETDFLHPSMEIVGNKFELSFTRDSHK
jgi:hypothetical protein